MLLHWIYLIHFKHMIDNNIENQLLFFQHSLTVPKYFQTSTNKPKFIHSKYITDNNEEPKNKL